MKTNFTMSKNIFQLHGYNAHTQLTRDKGGIYNLCRFKWYDWCYFCNSNQAFTLNKEKPGRVIGPIRGEGKIWRNGY